MPREIPEHPWQKIGIDLCYSKGQDHLFLTDYFSRYLEIASLSSTNSAADIRVSKLVFLRLRIPEIVCSDEGPQVDSYEFNQFAKEWSFRHEVSSPH